MSLASLEIVLLIDHLAITQTLTGTSFGFTACSEPMATDRPQDSIPHVRG